MGRQFCLKGGTRLRFDSFEDACTEDFLRSRRLVDSVAVALDCRLPSRLGADDGRLTLPIGVRHSERRAALDLQFTRLVLVLLTLLGRRVCNHAALEGLGLQRIEIPFARGDLCLDLRLHKRAACGRCIVDPLASFEVSDLARGLFADRHGLGATERRTRNHR